MSSSCMTNSEAELVLDNLYSNYTYMILQTPHELDINVFTCSLWSLSSKYGNYRTKLCRRRCYGIDTDIDIYFRTILVSSQKSHLITPLRSYHIKKGKIGKAVVVYAMKEFWGSTGKAPFILNISTIRRWVVNFVLQSLHPQERTPLPIQ